MLIQIPHCTSRLIDVCEFQKAETLGAAGLFVVDEAEVDDAAGLGEDFADLFFADACDLIEID